MLLPSPLPGALEEEPPSPVVGGETTVLSVVGAAAEEPVMVGRRGERVSLVACECAIWRGKARRWGLAESQWWEEGGAGR